MCVRLHALITHLFSVVVTLLRLDDLLDQHHVGPTLLELTEKIIKLRVVPVEPPKFRLTVSRKRC